MYIIDRFGRVERFDTAYDFVSKNLCGKEFCDFIDTSYKIIPFDEYTFFSDYLFDVCEDTELDLLMESFFRDVANTIEEALDNVPSYEIFGYRFCGNRKR